MQKNISKKESGRFHGTSMRPVRSLAENSDKIALSMLVSAWENSLLPQGALKSSGIR